MGWLPSWEGNILFAGIDRQLNLSLWRKTEARWKFQPFVTMGTYRSWSIHLYTSVIITTSIICLTENRYNLGRNKYHDYSSFLRSSRFYLLILLVLGFLRCIGWEPYWRLRLVFNRPLFGQRWVGELYTSDKKPGPILDADETNLSTILPINHVQENK